MLPKLKLLFFVLLLLIICAATVVWMYYGDRGTLVVDGEIPDAIQGVHLGDQKCTALPCHLIIRPGEYLLTFEKKDFNSVTLPVRVYLFDTTHVSLQFTVRPKLAEIGNLKHFSLPVNRVSPVFTDNQLRVELPARQQLQNFNIPESLTGIDHLWFSPTGNNLIATIGDTTYWMRPNLEPMQLSLSLANTSVTWTDESTLLFWELPAPNNFTLTEFSLATQKKSAVSTLYNLKEASVVPGKILIIVWDTQGTIYRIDRDSGRKETLLQNQSISALALSPSEETLLLKSTEGTYRQLDLATKSVTPLSLPAPLIVPPVYLSNDTLLIVRTIEKVLSVQSFNPAQNSYEDILKSETAPDPVSNEAAVVQKSLYLRLGEKLYQITGSY